MEADIRHIISSVCTRFSELQWTEKNWDNEPEAEYNLEYTNDNIDPIDTTDTCTLLGKIRANCEKCTKADIG